VRSGLGDLRPVGANRVTLVPMARERTPGVTVRDATADDVEAITAIVNARIETTTIEYADRPHTLESRRAWMAERQARGFPVLVAETEESGQVRVVGFASYGDFRDSVARPGYRYTVEHTVHVLEHWWGRGIGVMLVDELVDRATRAGLHAMIGAIDAENVDSIHFHERVGFVEVGRLPEVGTKFGRWLDLVLMQRML
jgi:L-amino acid N-acyltransferase YncA